MDNDNSTPVSITFTASASPYHKGDVAGFPAKEAKAYVDKRVARYTDEELGQTEEALEEARAELQRLESAAAAAASSRAAAAPVKGVRNAPRASKVAARQVVALPEGGDGQGAGEAGAQQRGDGADQLKGDQAPDGGSDSSGSDGVGQDGGTGDTGATGSDGAAGGAE